MIEAERFVGAAVERGFSTWSAVPCSYLQPLIDHVIGSPATRYVNAVNEAHAVAIAAGSGLGGCRGVAMFQNSGLGNAVNPLTSLAWVFRLPLLLVVTLRAEPGGRPDEPQHELMGRITTRMLELMEIPWRWFPEVDAEVEPALAEAEAHFEGESRPFALVMRHGAVAAGPGNGICPMTATPESVVVPGKRRVPSLATRARMLAALQAATGPGDLVVATTGYTGRELAALEDRPNQFYMVGSMGCASSFGLGLALAQPARRVIVVDGDGAALMHLGALAAIAHEAPRNLVHVVLDNTSYESTGGQATVSDSADLLGAALALGYGRGARIVSPEELAEAISDREPGLRMLHVPIACGVMEKLPRPKVSPVEVAARFRRHLAKGPG